jgi:hypothetical protein
MTEEIMETTTTIPTNPAAAETIPASKKTIWIGRIISAVPALVLLINENHENVSYQPYREDRPQDRAGTSRAGVFGARDRA